MGCRWLFHTLISYPLEEFPGVEWLVAQWILSHPWGIFILSFIIVVLIYISTNSSLGCSESLVTREMQITPVTMAIIPKPTNNKFWEVSVHTTPSSLVLSLALTAHHSAHQKTFLISVTVVLVFTIFFAFLLELASAYMLATFPRTYSL